MGNSRGQRRTQRALESSGLIRNGLVTGKALLSIKRNEEGKENKKIKIIIKFRWKATADGGRHREFSV